MAKKVEATFPIVKIVTDSKSLKALIASIGKGRAKLEAQVNAAVIGCAFHAAEHGDATLATRLVDTLGHKATGIRSNAVIKWFEEYAALKWTTSKDSPAQFKINKEAMAALKDRIEADREQVLLDLQETTPWQLSPQADFKGFNFMKELQALVNKAIKKQDNDEEADTAKVHNKEWNFDGVGETAKLLAELGKTYVKTNVKAEGKALH